MSNLYDLCLEIKYDLEDTLDLSLDTDEELYDLIEKKLSESKRFTLISGDDFSLDLDEDRLLIFYFDFEDQLLRNEVSSLEEYGEMMLKAITDKIIQSNQINLSDIKNKTIKIYYFTNHYGKMIQIEKLYDIKSKVIEEDWNYKLVKKINEKLDVKDSLKFKKGAKNNSFLFRQLNYFKKESNSIVQIESRVRRVTTEPLKNKARGEVYTASLFDLTQLFATSGNDLFKDNLRLRIKDESTNVDKEILRTLTESPDEFWYLNNGITLLVDRRFVEFKHSKQIAFNKVSSETDSDQILSVINGAQTLNAAASFFYDIKFKSDDDSEKANKQKEKTEKIEKAMKNAYVILRIIQVEYPKPDDISKQFDWINKIAIALNSQKPIKKEDIVSSLYFVQAINNIYDANKENEFTFSIIRRGERPLLVNRKYFIKELAKVLVTYIEKKPEKAKGSIQENIETSRIDDSEVYSFSSGAFLNQDILIDDSKEFSDRVEEYKTSIFETMYKPVNYLMMLNYSIDELSKRLKKLLKNDSIISSLNIQPDELENTEKSLKTILTYGKYHLILCIFENELSKLVPIDEIYKNGFTLDFNKKQTENDSEELSEEDKKKNKESNTKLIKDSLSLWNKDANDAQSTYNDIYLLKICFVFIDLWKKHVSKEEKIDKDRFKKEIGIKDAISLFFLFGG